MRNYKNTKHITFVIHPTHFQDYDIIGIGDLSILSKLKKKDKDYDLVKKSKFGGIPILIVDTCDNLKDAINCIRKHKDNKIWKGGVEEMNYWWYEFDEWWSEHMFVYIGEGYV